MRVLPYPAVVQSIAKNHFLVSAHTSGAKTGPAICHCDLRIRSPADYITV